jgi:hypothetical protein
MAGALRRPLTRGLVLVLTLVVCGCSEASGGPDRPAPPPPSRFETSGVVPVAGLSARQGAAIAWTGRELLVFGGYRRVRGTSDARELLSDGALVDVTSGRSVPLPRAPFVDALLYPTAARAGDSVVVTGIECADYRVEPDSEAYSCARASGRFALASFDPVEQRWSTVSRLPTLDALRTSPPWSPNGTQPGFWITQVLGTDSGDAVVTVQHDAASELWLHTATAGRLRRLPDAGAASNACVTGARVAVMSTVASSGVATTASIRLLDLSAPDVGWTDSPTTTLPSGFAPELDCLGPRIMTTNKYGITGTDGQVFDLGTQTWHPVTAPPANRVTSPNGLTFAMPFTGSPEQRIWNGSELLELTDFVALGSGTPLPSRAYDPTTNTWRALPTLPARMELPQWAGVAVVGYGTDHARSTVIHYLPT